MKVNVICSCPEEKEVVVEIPDGYVIAEDGKRVEPPCKSCGKRIQIIVKRDESSSFRKLIDSLVIVTGVVGPPIDD